MLKMNKYIHHTNSYGVKTFLAIFCYLHGNYIPYYRNLTPNDICANEIYAKGN